jgi:hypothetical protein
VGNARPAQIANLDKFAELFIATIRQISGYIGGDAPLCAICTMGITPCVSQVR